jgi:hypothetical protein
VGGKEERQNRRVVGSCPVGIIGRFILVHGAEFCDIVPGEGASLGKGGERVRMIWGEALGG